jgi:hypothetical protein
MLNHDIPQTLLSRLAFRRQMLIQAAARRDHLVAELKVTLAKTAEVPPSTHITEAQSILIYEIRQAKAQVAEIKYALRCLLEQCHQFEPPITAISNVAGDPLHLRMPSTRSRCWHHAVSLPTRDDT